MALHLQRSVEVGIQRHIDQVHPTRMGNPDTLRDRVSGLHITFLTTGAGLTKRIGSAGSPCSVW